MMFAGRFERAVVRWYAGTKIWHRRSGNTEPSNMGKRNSHATNGRHAPELGEIRARRRNCTTVPPYHLL